MKYKKGDTLIEVTLAVGIFSMIAIAIVAVMSNGTSSAQTALETTLTREEIDSQAEALRFIQASYVAGKTTDPEGKNGFSQLWKKITDQAIDLSATGVDKNAVLNFVPTSCNDLYLNDPSLIATQKAFILNTHGLGDFAKYADNETESKNQLNKVFFSATDSNKFDRTETYPHLVFTTQTGEADDNTTALTNDSFDTALYKAVGIYVIAVKDSNTTNIVDDATTSTSSAFYDFYIRTCWYGSNANEPSTISTVIRLYDPSVIKPIENSSGSGSGSGSTSTNPISSLPDDKRTMQSDSVTELIASVPEGRIAKLTDTRDGKEYQVKKISGKLWMIQNLAYNPGSSYGDLTAGNSYTAPRFHLADNNTQGAWYNYCAASANTDCSDLVIPVNPPSLCPANWHLPSMDELSSARTNVAFRSIPSPSYYSEGSLTVSQSAGWWSSTPEDSTKQQYLTTVPSSSKASKDLGLYIRCVHD